MQQVKTKDIAVIALAVLLVLFLWYRFLYTPTQGQTNKANQAAQDAKIQADSLQHQLNTLNGNGAPKKASNAELQNAVPATPEVSKFLIQVQQIRDAVGIPSAFQTIVPSTPTGASSGAATTGAPTTSFNVGITVQGSYAQMMDYVNRLNHLSRLVVVDNVQITAAGGEGQTSTGGPTGQVFAGQGAPPLLSLQVTARLLTRPAVAAAAAATGTTPATTPAATQNS